MGKAEDDKYVRIDTHLHSAYSNSSNLTLEFLAEKSRLPGCGVIVCTDNDDDSGVQKLFDLVPSAMIIPAIELETDDGDFLVFSTDRDYIHSLCGLRNRVEDLRRDEETAVVWAHPRVSQREDLSDLAFSEHGPYGSAHEEQIARITRHIDGLEYLNGTMLSLASCGLLRKTYFDNLKFLAERFRLAVTGGSDAHETEMWARVWTEFPEPIRCVRDFVRAIKTRATRPGYDRTFFKTDIETGIA